MIGRRRGGRVLLEHFVGRRFTLDPLDVANAEAVLLQQRDRHIELVAGDVGHLGRGVAGQGEADQEAEQHRYRDEYPDEPAALVLRIDTLGDLLLRHGDNRRKGGEGGGVFRSAAWVPERRVKRGDESVGALKALARLLLQGPHDDGIERR